MSIVPDPAPHGPEENPGRGEDITDLRGDSFADGLTTPEETNQPAGAEMRFAAPGAPESESYFDAYAHRVAAPPRFPNIADVGLMGILLGFGWLLSGAAAAAALHFHLFGVSTEKQAMDDVHYTLGSQAVWYLGSLAAWMMLFPRVWNKGFFAGLEWRAASALRLRWQLFSASFACFVLAIIDGLLLPGPKEAPIDEVFRLPGAAWGLVVFGVTLAPFIEEMIFRGFVLPALCTAWDWSAERIEHKPAPWPDEEGKTQWSLPAMAAASLVTSVPFALMHGYQTGYSLGPFVLLMCVSLALCWVRLSTRSLAASTLVHACYNLLLFSVMIWSTGGFKHLERM